MSIKLIVGGALVLLPSLALGGVVAHSSAPDRTSGVFLSCTNPNSVMVISNESDKTVVAGFKPDEKWEVELPRNRLKYRENFASPDGSAAVVRLSNTSGDSYLVTPNGAVPIDGGHVSIADFVEDRALVVRNYLDSTGALERNRVAIYDVPSGTRLADFDVQHRIALDVDRQLHARLSDDGGVFYYVVQNNAGERQFVVRDVASGRDVRNSIDWFDHGDIFDLMLLSREEGYLAATGGLFEVRGSRLRPLEIPRDIGSVTKIVTLGDKSHGFVGTDGWAVRNYATQQWVDSGTGLGFDIQAADEGFVLINRSVTRPELSLHSLSSGPSAVRRKLDQVQHLRQGEFVCANGFGVMRYRSGDFEWVPSKDPS